MQPKRSFKSSFRDTVSDRTQPKYDDKVKGKFNKKIYQQFLFHIAGGVLCSTETIC